MQNKDTRAVIIGGTQGLGLAIARRLVAEGCERMVISGRDRAKGAEAAAELSARGCAAHFIAADLGNLEDCRAVIEEAGGLLGPLNALVNAAATCDRGSLVDTTPDVWARLMDINARGPFFTMQAFVRQALANRTPASIVNIVSMVIHCGQSYLAPYSASKAALANITRNAAQAHRQDRIRCNAIACGWMDTPGEDATQKRYHNAPDNWLELAEAQQPFGQLVKPDQVAPLATYLLSPQSGVMTGAIIDCDQNVAGAYPE
ncbi:SDR family oxidoreductase [Nitratireductor sp. ZSWI3]|uniref:SDR family oxidoreductase n=1 Tax=Nitratireductor sp. ZSWI3 TaxID=2966359 RepID=UPI00214FC338|nr:SDR family oxidoreductase [Nitratireductor sp. ZSWI3]MCR4269294.1 SDR family oxidoreductase [Nitratireductor sp. ZSWI3]